MSKNKPPFSARLAGHLAHGLALGLLALSCGAQARIVFPQPNGTAFAPADDGAAPQAAGGAARYPAAGGIAPAEARSQLAAAQAGDTDAQLRLGLYYYQNSGLPNAPVQARQWLRQAAEGGDVRAMVGYAWLLANGIGGLRSVEQAREWLDQARRSGLPRANYVLSLVEGRMTGARKRALSRQLLEQAARDGDPLALNTLGVEVELEGEPMLARRWYEAAAAKGNHVARDNLERLRNPTRRGDALRLSQQRLRADDGDPDAMLQLAQRYHRGDGVQQDFAQALVQYQRAADAGSKKAQEALGLILSRPPADGKQGYDPAWMQELARRIASPTLTEGAQNVLAADRPHRNKDPLENLLGQAAAARQLPLGPQGQPGGDALAASAAFMSPTTILQGEAP